jgi:hypothetical protein
MPVIRSSDNPFVFRCSSVAGVDLTSGDVDDIFSVANGPVLIYNIMVHIDVAVSNNLALMHFESDPTVGAASTEITTAAGGPDIALAAIADVFALDGANVVMVHHPNGTTLPQTANNAGAGIFCPIGGIDMKLSTANPTTGEATVYVQYAPLVSGAYIG